LIINSMIPNIAKENLADFIDVFCEDGYFSIQQTDRILNCGVKYGLTPKIHVNQFTIMGGVQIGTKHNALSVDHLELLDSNDLNALIKSQTMPVALPSCSYFLGIPYTPARKIIDAGLPLALATDYNPGSTPSGNMNFVISTACIKMKMTPEEAINAATVNGAYAMKLSDSHGSITKGKKANLIITKEVPSYSFLPYAFGSNLIDKVIINGMVI
jgi:imidazolonepropionase